MKKLVVGIAFVIILDLAFIWMVGNRNDAPDVAQEVVPGFEESIVPPKPSREHVAAKIGEAIVDRDPASSAPADRPKDDPAPAPVPSRVRTSSIDKIRPPSLDAKRLFPDEIIYVGKYETPEASEPYLRVSPVKNSSGREVAAEPLPGAKRKSFKSRAFSAIKKPFNVIKKPFKWIGSVASKVVR